MKPIKQSLGDGLVREGLSAKATFELSDDDKAEGTASAKALRLE